MQRNSMEVEAVAITQHLPPSADTTATQSAHIPRLNPAIQTTATTGPIAQQLNTPPSKIQRMQELLSLEVDSNATLKDEDSKCSSLPIQVIPSNPKRDNIFEMPMSLNGMQSTTIPSQGESTIYRELYKHINNLKSMTVESPQQQNPILLPQLPLKQGGAAELTTSTQFRNSNSHVPLANLNNTGNVPVRRSDTFKLPISGGITESSIELQRCKLQLSEKEDELSEQHSKIEYLKEQLDIKEGEIIQLKQTNSLQLQIIEDTKESCERKIAKYQQRIQQNWRSSLEQTTTGDSASALLIHQHHQKQLQQDESNIIELVGLRERIADLERRLLCSENAREQAISENYAMAEKNMALNTETFDLQEELDSVKRELVLTKAQRRQEDSIFDDFASQQNKFMQSLSNYRKDLKQVFIDLSENSVLEGYKKHNDELLQENSVLREKLVKKKLEECESESENKDAKSSKERRSTDVLDSRDALNGINYNNNNNVSNSSEHELAGEIYASMMDRFAEMDERMRENDSEKFQAVEQKDFWFSKYQALDSTVAALKSQISLLQTRVKDQDAMIVVLQASQKTTKKGGSAAAAAAGNAQQQAKKRKQLGISATTISTTAENEEEFGEKKLKINTKSAAIDDFNQSAQLGQATENPIGTSPLKHQYSNGNNANYHNDASTFDTVGKTVQSVSISTTSTNPNNAVVASSAQITASTAAASVPSINTLTTPSTTAGLGATSFAGTTANTTTGSSAPSAIAKGGLFQLRICVKCSMSIKKVQPFESCSTCSKDYHTKCKGESIVGAFCIPCYEKQKKKTTAGTAAAMEVEKNISADEPESE